MSKERLNNLAHLTIEKELLADVRLRPSFYDNVIDIFSEKERRINLKYT